MHVWRSIRTLLLKLVLALLAISISMAIFRFGVLALIEFWMTPGSEVIAILRPAGTIVSALLGYWFFVRYFERRAVTELAFRPLAMAAAASSGALLILITILSLFAMEYYELQHYRGFAGVPRVIGYILIAALLEELLFRAVTFIPLSGTQEWSASAPFESRYEGSVWMTGGGFGPEDSIINVPLMAAVFVGMIYFAKRRKLIISIRKRNLA